MRERSTARLALARAALAALACGVCAPARAAASPPVGRAISVSLGAGRGTMSVGALGRSSVSPSFAAALGLDGRGRLSLVAELQPTGVENPVGLEAYHAGNLALGVSFGGAVRGQLVAGAQLRYWSGPRRVEQADAGPVVGASLAVLVRLGGRVDLVPEVVVRASLVEIEGNVRSSWAGFQLGVRFGGRR